MGIAAGVRACVAWSMYAIRCSDYCSDRKTRATHDRPQIEFRDVHPARRPRRGRPPLSVRSGIWDGALFVRDSITIYLCRVASASVTRFFFVAGDRNHAA